MIHKSTTRLRVGLCLVASLSQAPADDIVRVKDINPGPGDSSPSNFVRCGNFVYFAARDTVSGRELWRTDGTEAGTTLVKDLAAGSVNGFNADEASFTLGVMGGNLYFKSLDNYLWRSDGTTAGTTQLNPDKDLYLIGSKLYPLGNKVYFVGATLTTGNELWRTDGTVGGTSIVADINGGPGNSGPANFALAGDSLYFNTSVTTQLLRVNLSGVLFWPTGVTAMTSFSQGVEVGGLLYFMGNDGVHGIELMKSDGTAAGTSVVKDLNPGSGNSDVAQLTRVGNLVYFVKENSIWKSDGTDAGTVPVYTRGTEDFAFAGLTGVGNTLYFAGGMKADGQELWKSDGTTAGTMMVKDIYPVSKKSAAPEMMIPVGNRVYFRANDGVNGICLWKSDGTAAGTVRLTGPSPERFFFDGQQRVYCSAYSPDGNGWELYKYDVPVSEQPVVDARAAWRMTYFNNSANSGAGADGADPDHDGLTNLMEFALGADPRVADTDVAVGLPLHAGKPVAVAASGAAVQHVLFSRRSNLGAAGVTAVPQFSSNLSGWQDASGVPDVLGSEGDLGFLSLDVPLALRTSDKVFFRLKVVAAE